MPIFICSCRFAPHRYRAFPWPSSFCSCCTRLGGPWASPRDFVITFCRFAPHRYRAFPWLSSFCPCCTRLGGPWASPRDFVITFCRFAPHRYRAFPWLSSFCPCCTLGHHSLLIEQIFCRQSLIQLHTAGFTIVLKVCVRDHLDSMLGDRLFC